MSDSHLSPNARVIAIGGLLGLVGCVTTLVVFLALGLGLWLDARFQTRPWLTITAMLASVPVTLYLMFRIVLGGIARLQERGKASPVGEGTMQEKED